MAAMGCTLTIAVSRARRRTKSTSATSSITGSVLGMQTMVVTPPAAAAWLAVASVSRCSWPGSPVKTIMSIEAGREHMAAAIDDLGIADSARSDVRPEIGDEAVRDQHAAALIEAARPDRSAAH